MARVQLARTAPPLEATGAAADAPGPADTPASLPAACRQGLWIAVGFTAGLSLLQLALPLYSMQIFDRVLPSGNFATLVALSVIMALLIGCTLLIDGARSAVLARSACRLDLAWRGTLLGDRLAGGTAAAEALRDLDLVRSFLSGPMATAVIDAPWSLVFLATVFLFDWRLGCLTSLGMLAVLLLAAGGEARALAGTQLVQRRASQAHAALDAGVQDLLALTAMGRIGATRRLLEGLHAAFLMAQVCAAGRQGWLTAALRAVRSGLQVAILTAATVLVLRAEVPTGAIVASTMLFARALAPVERLAAGARSILATYAAWRRLRARLAVSVAPVPVLALPPLEGHLEAVDLGASVPGQARPTLQGVSFALRPGQLLVIVGASGSGKSTLAQLLAGATAASEGAVRLDGTNLPDFDREALGVQVGYLPQTFSFQAGRVGPMIARGGDVDDAAVVEAAKLAGAHEMIQRLPAGYQTELGPQGCRLSTGEQQRLALARAFYGRPAVIVLDQPTAHLDDEGEKQVLGAIASLKGTGSTIVVVSRLGGLLHLADRLMMIERGQMKFCLDQAEFLAFLGPRLAVSRPPAARVEVKA